jgi:hypothetical protein
VIAVCLFQVPGKRPKGFPNILVTAIDYLLLRAGDDPSSAEVCISLPMAGLGSILKPSGAKRSMALGRQMATEAMPAIRALLE